MGTLAYNYKVDTNWKVRIEWSKQNVNTEKNEKTELMILPSCWLCETSACRKTAGPHPYWWSSLDQWNLKNTWKHGKRLVFLPCQLVLVDSASFLYAYLGCFYAWIGNTMRDFLQSSVLVCPCLSHLLCLQSYLMVDTPTSIRSASSTWLVLLQAPAVMVNFPWNNFRELFAVDKGSLCALHFLTSDSLNLMLSYCAAFLLPTSSPSLITSCLNYATYAIHLVFNMVLKNLKINNRHFNNLRETQHIYADQWTAECKHGATLIFFLFFLGMLLFWAQESKLKKKK